MSQAVSARANVDGLQLQKSVLVSLCKLKMFLLLTKCQLVKPLLKVFTGHNDNDKCNTWGLEATAIPKHVKVQHIKGIANVLANSVSRIRAVGLYHDLDFKGHHNKFSAPFEPLLLIHPMTHTTLEIYEVYITSYIEKHMQNYDALHDLTNKQTDKAEL